MDSEKVISKLILVNDWNRKFNGDKPKTKVSYSVLARELLKKYGKSEDEIKVIINTVFANNATTASENIQNGCPFWEKFVRHFEPFKNQIFKSTLSTKYIASIIVDEIDSAYFDKFGDDYRRGYRTLNNTLSGQVRMLGAIRNYDNDYFEIYNKRWAYNEDNGIEFKIGNLKQSKDMLMKLVDYISTHHQNKKPSQGKK